MNKYLHRFASRVLWQLCRLAPIQKNKVVFCSMGGRGFGENPKAIALSLLESGRDLDLVWLACDRNTPVPKGIRVCLIGTLQSVFELSTAAVWVNDSRSGAKHKKKGQHYLQTWHGFALKHIEKSAKGLPQHYVEQCKKDSKMIDLMVSGSKFMSRIYREDFWYDGEIGEFGSPRNDVFFCENDAANKVREFFSLPEGRKFFLYAPTFRDDGATDCYAMAPEAVAEACEKRFGGEWSALIRLHPNAAKLSQGLFPYDGARIVDATAYPDMAQLLLACDMLITDYSSSMFDYALGKKPCFQFAADIERYTQGRGFYFPLDSLPFPLARSNEALCNAIENFDEGTQNVRWANFAEKQGFCEDGNAAKRCAQWILDRMKG